MDTLTGQPTEPRWNPRSGYVTFTQPEEARDRYNCDMCRQTFSGTEAPRHVSVCPCLDDALEWSA